MNKVLYVVAMAAIVLCSCIKEGGPQGPSGPSGPPGRDGKDGKDGMQINTYYIGVDVNKWASVGRPGSADYFCFADIQLNALTRSVIDEGAVLVYFIDVVGDQEFDNQLPYIYPFQDNGLFVRIIRYDLQPGKIGLIVQDSDFRTPMPPFNRKVEIKVVIISKI